MLYRILGKTGYKVSAVVYGGVISTDEGQPASDEHVAKAVHMGVNYFDIAPSYGDAQEKLGHSLKPFRKEVMVACKTTQRNRKDALADITRSFEQMHTDYFDLYQLHSLTTPLDIDEAFGPGGTMELLRELKEKGAVRKVGFSAHSEYAALKALTLYDFDTVLFPTNYQLDMGQGIGRAVMQEKAGRGFGLLGMKSIVERAWMHDNEKVECGYPKSWCKPFAPEEKELRLAAMRYGVSMGADVLVPPGNFECFTFMANNVEEAYAQPLSAHERALLKERFEKVKQYPFFEKNNGHWEDT